MEKNTKRITPKLRAYLQKEEEEEEGGEEEEVKFDESLGGGLFG
jgi:hypothetical protein